MAKEGLTDEDWSNRYDYLNDFFIEAMPQLWKIAKPNIYFTMFDGCFHIEVNDPFTEDGLGRKVVSFADFVNEDIDPWWDWEQEQMITQRIANFKELIKLYEAKQVELFGE